jgi:hypothetical protein
VVQVCASAGDALMMLLMAAIRPPANTTAKTTVKISFFMVRSPDRLKVGGEVAGGGFRRVLSGVK